jgi:uncharacterized protein (UPF0264 family)
MRLLVSVSGSEEAAAALAGGADLIDAKDPAAGPIGAVRHDVFDAIVATVAAARPVTAALGDPASNEEAETLARRFAGAGAALLKIGVGEHASVEHVHELIASAVRGATHAGDGSGVIVVAYADRPSGRGAPLLALIDAAARAGARGLLVDTMDKNGPSLPELVDAPTLAGVVRAAHQANLLCALAGRLSAGDLSCAYDAGADVVGVRGAVCEGGRTGRVVRDRVQALRCTLADHGPRRLRGTERNDGDRQTSHMSTAASVRKTTR